MRFLPSRIHSGSPLSKGKFASSSFFAAIVMWLIFKWDTVVADEAQPALADLIAFS